MKTIISHRGRSLVFAAFEPRSDEWYDLQRQKLKIAVVSAAGGDL